MKLENYVESFSFDVKKNVFEDAKEHGKHCEKLCKKIFSNLCVLGLFNDESQKLLNENIFLLLYAANLHDIGSFLKGDKPHNKMGAKLILQNKIENLSDIENTIVANIVRYHRGKAPKEKHKIFANLDDNSKKIVMVFSAILRIADALDFNHFSLCENIILKDEKTLKNLIIAVNSNIMMNIGFVEVFNKKKKLLEKLLMREISIEPL